LRTHFSSFQAGSNCVSVDERNKNPPQKNFLFFLSLSLTGSTGTDWNFRRKTRDVMPFANYSGSFFYIFIFLSLSYCATTPFALCLKKFCVTCAAHTQFDDFVAVPTA
jgi:hypothetical protein